MNLKIILFVLILAIIPISSAFAGMGGMNNNTGGFYFAVDVTADMIENQLVIDAPAKAMAGDTIKIKVTANGAGIGNATINIDNDTDITYNKGILNYTLPRSLNGTYSITASKTGYKKATQNIEISNNLLEIQCLNNESLISRNIVIVIDNSGSTAFYDEGTGISFIDLINANAMNIILNTGWDSRVGVVTFGGIPTKTDVLPMNNETNKKMLERFIKASVPKGPNPTNLDVGLLVAEESLKLLNGTKEIIVLSDGNIPIDESKRTIDPVLKNVVLDLRNKGIKVHFVQMLNIYMSSEFKKANGLYNELANESVIVLNPDERISTVLEIVPPKEQCSVKAYDMITITVAAGKGNPIEGAEVSFDGMIIGRTNNTGKIDYIFISSGLYNITATKPEYETVVKMVQVLPASNITLNPAATINLTQNTDSQLKGVEEPLNKTEEERAQGENRIPSNPGFTGINFLIAGLIFVIILRNKNNRI